MTTRLLRQQERNVVHNFLPADEWIYYKFYGGPNVCQKLLITQIHDLVRYFLSNNVIDLFFFIRYSDPDYHLRVRLHLKDKDYVGRVIEKINSRIRPLMQIGTLNYAVLDTYKREFVRYGEPTMCFAESLFFLDSIFVINCHRLQVENEPWLISTAFINRILDIFQFDAVEKLNICKNSTERFSTEFNLPKQQKRLMDLKYRYYQMDIESCLLSSESLESYGVLLERYLDEITPIINKIIETKNEMREPTLISFAISIIHMHFNRMFQEQARGYEFVVYYFLFKAYKSHHARLSTK